MIRVWSIATAKFDDIFEIFAKSYLEKVRYTPLLIVDDGLSEELKKKYDCFLYIPSPKPFAFCLSINKGLEYTDPSDVIIWNDDIFIHTRDIDRLLFEISQERPEIGILAPVSTNVMNKDQLPENRTEERVKFTRNDIGFGCGTFVPREVINKVGQLDIEYTRGIAGREDRDYCVRVRKADYKLAIAQTCMIEHGGSRFGRNVSCTRARIPGQLEKAVLNRSYFKEKFNLQDEL